MRDGLTSLLLLPSLLILRTLIARAVAKNPTISMEAKRRWVDLIRNTVVFVLQVGLVVIWAHELQAFAVSLLALVFATKRLEIGQGPASHLYTGRVHVVLRFPRPRSWSLVHRTGDSPALPGLHVLNGAFDGASQGRSRRSLTGHERRATLWSALPDHDTTSSSHTCVPIRRCRMQKLIVVAFTALCLTGTSSLALADEAMKGEMGNMKDEMKAEKNAMKGDMKAKKEEMKGKMKARKDAMKAKRHEMKGKIKAHKDAAKANSAAPAPISAPAPAAAP